MILQGNCIETLKTLDSGSVDCCITSPPYWGLRDYGTADWEGGDANCEHKSAKEKSRYDYAMQDGSRHAEIAKTTSGTDQAKWKDTCPDCGAVKKDSQLGLEKTPEEYVSNMVKVFAEVKRVLKKDGTLWLNLGDSYCMSSMRGKNSAFNGLIDQSKQGIVGLSKSIPVGMKPKDLVGIPWMVAFALRADGWWLRQDIIWHKPNPMPESVRDRCTKAHEYIFLMSKSQKYYCDMEAIKSPHKRDWTDCGGSFSTERHHNAHIGGSNRHKRPFPVPSESGANKRSVWTVTTKPYSEAHFATYPEELIEPCVKAGCPEGGVILDPFFGAGTTGLVAYKHRRNYIGCELNPEYIKIAEKRIQDEKDKYGLFE